MASAWRALQKPTMSSKRRSIPYFGSPGTQGTDRGDRVEEDTAGTVGSEEVVPVTLVTGCIDVVGPVVTLSEPVVVQLISTMLKITGTNRSGERIQAPRPAKSFGNAGAIIASDRESTLETKARRRSFQT